MFVLFAVILLAVIGVIGWCAWRLLAKKRTKKDQKQADIDEQAILDAMEEEMDVNEEELKVNLTLTHNCDGVSLYNTAGAGSGQGVPGQAAV